ncbi:MAG: phage portal protein [Loktanella sp.]|nr:phage portal protein [Loktanella sp.]
MIRAAIRALMPGRKRSLDAAGGGRRWRDAPLTANAGTIHGGAATIAGRASHFALNSPLGARAVEVLVANAVGSGIKPRSLHPRDGVRDTLHRRFLAWTDEADADGLSDFFGLQQAAMRDLVIHGEALFQIIPDRMTLAPTLRRLHPEQLDRSLTRQSDDNVIYSGIEFDRTGRRVAYHVRPHAPGDMLAGMAATPTRMGADEVLHVYRPLAPGQVRGLSWFAPVLLTARDLDTLADAMTVRARVAALFAGFIRKPDGQPILDGEQSGAELDVSMEPGALVNLGAGDDVTFPTMPDQGGAAGLMEQQLRAIASGLGITYEQLTGDFSQVNYSSARAALLEFRRFIGGVQHHTLIHQFSRPIWREWVRAQVLAGGIPAAEFARDRADFMAVKWLPPAWQWVDPLKDAKAAETEINANLRSRAEVIAERGYDVEEVDQEIASDAARLARLTGGQQGAEGDTE